MRRKIASIYSQLRLLRKVLDDQWVELLELRRQLAHVEIVGLTQSGKSRLALSIFEARCQQGYLPDRPSADQYRESETWPCGRTVDGYPVSETWTSSRSSGWAESSGVSASDSHCILENVASGVKGWKGQSSKPLPNGKRTRGGQL